MYRIILSILFLALNGVCAFANNTPALPSVIKSVIVYRQGAKVEHQGTATLKQGSNEIVFDNLIGLGVNESSLQVTVKGNSKLLSAKYSIDYLTETKDQSGLTPLRDSSILLNDQITTLNNERQVYQQEENLITTASAKVGNGTQTGLTVAEMKSMTEFYRSRLFEIRKNTEAINIKLRNLNEAINRINNQINQISSVASRQTGKLLLNIHADNSETIQIVFSYLTMNASWTPLYDLRSKGVDKTIEVIAKAAIYQSSGIEWKNVTMRLSTGNPTLSNNRPILNPRYVDFYVPYAYGGYADGVVSTTNMAQVPATEQLEDVKSVADKPRAPQAQPDEIVNSIFEVKYAQNIPTDGQEHIVIYDEYDMPATYEYHSVPRLDPAAFLLAKIAEFGKYNLQPGTANIFLEDTYIGQTFLDPRTVADTLLLSLGRDENISVKRTEMRDLTEIKTLGANKKETHVYEIFVKNNKNVPINIDILDQIPITNNADIEVKLLESNAAQYITEYGKLEWRANIPAYQNKRIRFSYYIKYPKDKAINCH